LGRTVAKEARGGERGMDFNCQGAYSKGKGRLSRVVTGKSVSGRTRSGKNEKPSSRRYHQEGGNNGETWGFGQPRGENVTDSAKRLEGVAGGRRKPKETKYLKGGYRRLKGRAKKTSSRGEVRRPSVFVRQRKGRRVFPVKKLQVDFNGGDRLVKSSTRF